MRGLPEQEDECKEDLRKLFKEWDTTFEIKFEAIFPKIHLISHLFQLFTFILTIFKSNRDVLMNYQRLGDYIRDVNARNRDLKVTKPMDINIDKHFMSSVANVIGTDLSTYKLVVVV